MQRVIVTVKRKDEARVRDLELPADVEAERLAELIAQALHWDSDPAGEPVRYEIEAHPLGRTLHPYESLVGAGVWDGSWLVLYPSQPEMIPVEAAPEPEAESDGPAQAFTPQQPGAPVEAEIVPEAMLPLESIGEPTSTPEPAVPAMQQAAVEETPGEMADQPDDLMQQYSFEGSKLFRQLETPPAVEPQQTVRTEETGDAGGEGPDSPVISGWRGLGIDLPTTHSHVEEQVEESGSSGFVWKQLDE